ncbi:MAG TPA: maleylacetate reductase, partial [Ktedonobacterales bacterium]
VIFGRDSLARALEELDQLNARHPLILYSPHCKEVAGALSALLGDRLAGFYEGSAAHVPIEAAEAARAAASKLNADCCIAIGGGSTIGLAKAIALVSSLPIIAVPTTYAGSEMTPIWGITQGGQKNTGRDWAVLPRVAIYDPRLTLDVPPQVAAPSGVNAIAHCVEALYSSDTNPIVTLMAAEGVRALANALPRVVASPRDLDARADALYGAWLAGAALGAVGMGLHHKLCHVLGGSFNLPHAETHAVILPHVISYNREAAPEAIGQVATALGVRDAARGMFDFTASLSIPTTLRDIGMREQDLDRAAEIAVRTPYANPAPVTYAGVRRLLDDAFHGRLPGSTQDS